MIGYFKSLFSVIRLRNEEVFNIYSKLLGIEPVECVFGINDSCNSATFLSFGNCMYGECGFP